MVARDFLRASGLPAGDLNELPDSAKRFRDGAQFRVEIPSTEGPVCLDAVLEQAARLDVLALACSGYEPIVSGRGASGLALPVPRSFKED